MKTSVLSVLLPVGLGAVIGLSLGPSLRAAGVSMLAMYMTLVVVLHGCYFVATCRN
jgi:hypothetical protein